LLKKEPSVKKVLRTTAIAVLVIVLVGGIGAWYYLAGPGLQGRTNGAIAAIAQDKKVRAASSKALSTVSPLPDTWANLDFDEAKEISLVAADLAENRQYKVDNYRSPAAAKVAGDIAAAEKTLQKTDKDLLAARNQLAGYQNAHLKAKQIKDINAALRDNAAALREVKATRSGLKELKSDNYIWGHLAVVVKADGDIITALTRADAALKAGDYVALQDAARASRAALADSIDWLQVGELELTNVGIYSRDAAELKRFISKAMDTTQAYEQATLFMFGNRADAGALQQATDRAVVLLSNLQKQADAQKLGQGYKAWFLAAAHREL
jgi:hypothetical protein